MSKEQIQALAMKIAYAVTLLIGVAFTTYNLFSFKVVRNGYYYVDDNQTWLALGTVSLAIAYLIKNWNKS